MLSLTNATKASLILPGEIEVAPGASIKISKDTAANSAVSGWIAGRWLVPDDEYEPVVVETIADLKAQVAELQAQLEAATAPAKK